MTTKGDALETNTSSPPPAIDMLAELDKEPIFEVTGCAAHGRIAPLLPSNWINKSPYYCCKDAKNTNTNKTNQNSRAVDFLWENAPRFETKSYRNSVKCYSHLPNGTAILDDKWVMARLIASEATRSTNNKNTNTNLAILESHCFRGLEGFQSFCKTVNMIKEEINNDDDDDSNKKEPADADFRFPDLLEQKDSVAVVSPSTFPPTPPNLWVVKDASSNGAGGIWVVSPENISTLDGSASEESKNNSPLMDQHRYVAQRYAWPPVLYGGRKCHVRVYGLVTSDGRAFVHKRAFLHVANEIFQKGENPSNDEVHITNCCANSHDKGKFSGEICADLEETEWGTINGTDAQVVPLEPFYASICASVATLIEQTMPFLRGGEANNGFEYLGMDFILSYSGSHPIAYLLEVNAPPSQDTATGLSHAEHLHDQVIRDIITLWVLPKIVDATEILGGWKCIHGDSQRLNAEECPTKLILPSKAAILNKIRWAIYERKASRLSQDGATLTTDKSPSNKSLPHGKSQAEVTAFHTKQLHSGSLTADAIARNARSQFPYFVDSPHRTQAPIFFENAGGSQVPHQVIRAVSSSLAYRHRDEIGSRTKEQARNTLLSLLGGVPDEHTLFLGSNASSLFDLLARQYVQLGLLKENDEIIISNENHLANVNPWLDAAKAVGATVKWWICASSPLSSKKLYDGTETVSHCMEDLLTERTRIVAVSHASNVVGEVRDLAQIGCLVKQRTRGYAHVVADGVAAAPHLFPAVSQLDVDWYAVSCHKMFGPHLGGLCGKHSVVSQLGLTIGEKALFRQLEIGTINYEACAGIQGVGQYLHHLASSRLWTDTLPCDRQTRNQCTQSKHDRDEDCRLEIIEKDSVDAKTNFDHFPWVELSIATLKEAYHRIRVSEVASLNVLLMRLRQCNKVCIIESPLPSLAKIPVVGFVHKGIKSSVLVSICAQYGIVCRHGTFLCALLLMEELRTKKPECSSTESSQSELDREGIFRVSLVHYNTVDEVQKLMRTLESIPGWH